MKTSEQTYTPGVCNIGLAERKRRRTVGYVCLVLTLLLWTACAVFEIAAPWRLLLALPAAGSAVGFLQYAWHFCARFGLGGVFHFGPDAGKTDSVTEAEFRKKDRAQALKILSLSLLVGLLVGIAAYLIPI